MLGRLAKLLLVMSSVAPITFTWAFADYRARGARVEQASALVVTGLLVLLCHLVMTAARHHLSNYQFQAKEMRHADSEVLGFLVAYLLPLVSTKTSEFDYWLLAFVGGMVAIVVWTSEAYSFNPLLSLFGFHFYEVTNDDGVTYVIVTKSRLRRCRDISSVAEISGSVLLDTTSRRN